MERFLLTAVCCLAAAGCGNGERSQRGPAPAETAFPIATETPPAELSRTAAAGPGAAPGSTFPPEEHRQPGAIATEAVAGPAPPKPAAAQQPPHPAKFAESLQEVLTLEQDAEFSQALKRCQQTRSDFAKHPDAPGLGKIITRLREEKRAAPGLMFALQKLESGDDTEVAVAAEQFRDGGEAGRVILRKMVRQRSDKIAREAAGILIELDDVQSLPLFVKKLQESPESKLAEVLVAGLCSLADRADAAEFAGLYPFVKDDSGFEWRRLVPLLRVTLQKTCGGDKAKFNELVADPDAFARLASYLEAALASEDEKVFDWAMENFAPFAAEVPGLKGSYFEGRDFGKLVHEQLDFKVDVSKRGFPFPDGSEDGISAKWSGSLLVQNPGKYTFHCAGTGGRRLWLDDQLLIDVLSIKGDKKDKKKSTVMIELFAGSHPLKIEFSHHTGPCRVKLFWSGPGIKRELISRNVLRTVPWTGMKTAAAPQPKQPAKKNVLRKKPPKLPAQGKPPKAGKRRKDSN